MLKRKKVTTAGSCRLMEGITQASEPKEHGTTTFMENHLSLFFLTNFCLW